MEIDIEKKERYQVMLEKIKKNIFIDNALYPMFDVKRGLRNADGTGVLAGLTRICNVHGYIISEFERVPCDGILYYRGINVVDIINGCNNDDRLGFEETAYLLLCGDLPSPTELYSFVDDLHEYGTLPNNFVEDMIMKAASPNIMNVMARSVLALYSYDDNAEDTSLETLFKQSMSLISLMPSIMVTAFQVKKRVYGGESLLLHHPDTSLSIAENILSMLRTDRRYTKEEARILDRCLIAHADHGGGNNSTFVCRAISTSGTDTYSAISAGIGALKGPKHGGANIKVMEMLSYMKEEISDVNDDEEITAFLKKLLDKEAGDRSGLIYGTGHAVYTVSDPRVGIIKREAGDLFTENGLEDDYKLLNAVERIAPVLLSHKKGVCANVDLYSGLVYKMLGIHEDLFTPLFAVARVAGWCAHRIEEILTGSRIMRPAYRSVSEGRFYTKLEER